MEKILLFLAFSRRKILYKVDCPRKKYYNNPMKIYKAENLIKTPLSFNLFKTIARNEELHTHDFVEIVYIADGFGTERVGNSSYSVKRGDLLFIGCGNTHAFVSDKGLTYYNIAFSAEVILKHIENKSEAVNLLSLAAWEELRREDNQMELLHFEGKARAEVEGILEDMLEEYKNALPERIAVLESYMTILLAKILRAAHSLRGETGFDGIWSAVSDFIDSNIQEKLTLFSIAQKYFYNSSYFSRAFKQKFGCSLVEYIARERVKKAEELLRTTTESVESIALACGFGDRTSLYRAFEKNYGCLPTEYRRVKGKKTHK